VIQKAYIHGVSTRKIKKLAKQLGIESISRGQVSQMTKELNEQVEAFRNRRWKRLIRSYGWMRFMRKSAMITVWSIWRFKLSLAWMKPGRDILAIEPMQEESEATYKTLFDKLKARGLEEVWLVVSDAHPGLCKAIKESFVGCSWKRCKVHFMRNILARVPSKDKESFAARLKQIWLQLDYATAQFYAESLMDEYEASYPEAIQALEEGLEDSLQFYHFGTDGSSKDFIHKHIRTFKPRNPQKNQGCRDIPQHGFLYPPRDQLLD
jgi:putative transposase